MNAPIKQLLTLKDAAWNLTLPLAIMKI